MRLPSLLEIKDQILGEHGGATKREMTRMVYRNKFSKFLPWAAYDSKTKVYANHDSTVGYLWECIPHCFSSKETYKTLEGLFRSGLPVKSVLQFILVADDEIGPVLNRYRSMLKRDIPVLRKAREEFCNFLRQGVNGLGKLQDMPVRNFRLFVAVKMDASTVRKEKVNIKRIRTAIQETLNGAGLNPVELPPGDLLEWLRRLFNGKPMKNPDIYNDWMPINKQIILSDNEVLDKFETMEIGGRKFKCITPKLYCKDPDPLKMNRIFGGIEGVSDDATQALTPFLYSVNVVVDNLKAAVEFKGMLINGQKPMGGQEGLLAQKQAEFRQATNMLNDGAQFVRFMPVVWMWDEDEAKLEESISRMIRVWDKEGFEMQRDMGILKPLFISSLPFGLYNQGKNLDNLERDFVVPAKTAANCLPTQGDFMGNGRPGSLFIGRKGQLCGMDITFKKGGSNMNSFVGAGSGGGKSFMVNKLVIDHFGNGCQVRLVDIGGSYKKQALMLGARYMEFSPEHPIVINPFQNIIEDETDEEGEVNDRESEREKSLNNVAGIIGLMVYSGQNDPKLSETESSLLKKAVRWAYESKGKKAIIDDVKEFLDSYGKEESGERDKHFEELVKTSRDMAFNLRDFTSEGVYGKYFCGEGEFDISKDDFVILELEHLASQKELFRVVTTIVIDAVTADLYLGDRKTVKWCIFDEAWQFLNAGGGSIIKNEIESGYRRARKYEGAFTVITQSILDLAEWGPVGKVIRNSASYKWYLASEDFDAAVEAKLVDLSDFELGLAKSVKNNRPNYSEVFIRTEKGQGVVRVCVDDFGYYVATSDGGEVAEIEDLVKGGMNYIEAIEEMIRRHRRK